MQTCNDGAVGVLALGDFVQVALQFPRKIQLHETEEPFELRDRFLPQRRRYQFAALFLDQSFAGDVLLDGGERTWTTDTAPFHFFDQAGLGVA